MSTVESHVPDPLARTMTMIYGAGAVVVVVVAYEAAGKANWPAVVLYAVLALLLGFQAWSANSMRQADLTVDDDGVRRRGAWGWRQPWSGIASATVEEFKERHYLVLLRANPNAGSHHSSTWLWGSGFPRTALVTPLDPDQVPAVTAVLTTRGVPDTR